MHDVDWDDVAHQLNEAADRVALLARCLAVAPELTKWRAGNEVAGMSAADALDQACGDLEISNGEAAAMLELVQRVLDDLPLPLE